MGEFTLHSRLREDTLEVADLRLSRVLLMNDARFPWLVLVPRRIDVCELFDLKPEDRSALVEEIAIVAQMLQSQTNCIKVNIAALGNQVPQLHVHVIARFVGDAAWPQPVWCARASAQPYGREEAEEVRANLQEGLRALFSHITCL